MVLKFFSYYFRNGTIFGKYLLYTECPATLVQNSSHSKKNLATYYHKCTYVST